MTLKKVVSGEPIEIKASTWNVMLDAATAYRVDQEKRVRPVFQQDETRGATVVVRNDTGSNRVLGDCVALGAPITQPSVDTNQFASRSWFAGTTPGSTNFGGAVLAEPIPDGEFGLAYVSGIVSARINVTTDTDWLRRCDLDSAHVMDLMPHGSHEVLWFESGTGTKWATVRLGVPQDVSIACKPDSTVTPGGTGTVSVWSNGSDTNLNITPVHLDWMHNSENISADKQCVAKWFCQEKRWRFVGAECES